MLKYWPQSDNLTTTTKAGFLADFMHSYYENEATNQMLVSLPRCQLHITLHTLFCTALSSLVVGMVEKVDEFG